MATIISRAHPPQPCQHLPHLVGATTTRGPAPLTVQAACQDLSAESQVQVQGVVAVIETAGAQVAVGVAATMEVAAVA
jgi:hypothetical protein